MNFFHSLTCTIKKIFWNLLNLPDFIQRLKYYPVIIPPRRLRRSKYIKEFLADGQIQLQRLVKYANLNSKSNLLDIGCGGEVDICSLTCYQRRNIFNI